MLYTTVKLRKYFIKIDNGYGSTVKLKGAWSKDNDTITFKMTSPVADNDKGLWSVACKMLATEEAETGEDYIRVPKVISPLYRPLLKYV